MSKHLHRAAIFTIHNPTRHVQAVLDRALSAYTSAYTTILHHFSQYGVDELHAMATIGLDENGEQVTHTQHLASSLFSHCAVPCIISALTPLESSLREALKLDIAANLMSYIELSLMPDQTPSYPERLRAQDKEPARLQALEGLRTIADNLPEETELWDQLQRTRQSEYRPLNFCRIDAHRNCGLFYNPETKQFYARLFVLPTTSKRGKPITMAGKYIDIRSGEVYMRQEDAKQQEGVISFGTSARSIMVLLEMGKWHEEVLRFTDMAFLPQRGKSEVKAATPVSASLIKRGDAYQLHVMFRFPKPARLKAQTLLGVDRGITCLAAGAVTSLDTKEVKETFICDGTELRALQKNLEHITKIRQQKGQPTKGDKRRSTIADHHVHACANQIVELAIKHQSQVVMEDLSAFAAPQKRVKGTMRNNFAKMLPRRQYQKLQDIVNAKLALVGLPPVRTVYAAFTSLTCSTCGCISKESRSTEDRTQFICVECHHEAHADAQAGINIARKITWLALRSQEKQKEIPDTKRTSWAAFIKQFLACKV